MPKKKRFKTVKIKSMNGARNKNRDEPGWLCRCIECHSLGYIELGDTPPDLCEECAEE